MTQRPVEVWVSEREIAIHYRHFRVATIGIGEDGVLRIHQPSPREGEVEWTEDALLGLIPLTVDVVTHSDVEEEHMSLPRSDRARASTRRIRPRKRRERKRVDSNRDTIDEVTAKKVLSRIIKHLRTTPNPTGSEIRAESHAIAADLGIDVMQVAGVRANFTRGSYGDPKRLMREARQRARTRSANG